MSINKSERKDKYNLTGFMLSFFMLTFYGQILGQQPEQNYNSKEVVFNVTVGTADIAGNNDGFITGLSSNMFSIYDEGKLQTVTKFAQKDIPMSIGILYDVSTSPKISAKMVEADKVNPIILGGLRRFIELSHPANEYFFLTFNETHNLLSDYTQDAKGIFKIIDQAEKIKAAGGSNLYDAIRQGTEKLSKSKYSKRVLLVITDGLDSNSKIKIEELENKLKNSDVLIFAFSIYKGTNGVIKNVFADTRMDELTAQTGGEYYYRVWNYQTKGSIVEKGTRGIFVSIANELRSQYTIGFKSDGVGNQANSFWHDIKIKVKMPSGVKGVENVYVRTRKGYYSNSK